MNMRGTPVRLSRMRGLLRDQLRASAGVPFITVQRTMSLGRLVAARNACTDRPPWSAIFVKGYALVARDTDELRRAYLAFPWGRVYQYPHSVANIAVERSHDGENVVFHLLVGHPADLTIVEIGRRIRHAKGSAIGELREFRRTLGLAALPSWLRRIAIWLGLNLGRRRSRFFGTFGLSTVVAAGGELLNVIWPLGTVVTYGPFSAAGTITVRLIFDHRVADAAAMARALTRLEATLNGPVAGELVGGAARPTI
jgi:hypothetical protein